MSSKPVRSLFWPLECIINQFWAVLEPLNSHRGPMAWSTPVNISQLLHPTCVASESEKKISSLLGRNLSWPLKCIIKSPKNLDYTCSYCPLTSPMFFKLMKRKTSHKCKKQFFRNKKIFKNCQKMQFLQAQTPKCNFGLLVSKFSF